MRLLTNKNISQQTGVNRQRELYRVPAWIHTWWVNCGEKIDSSWQCEISKVWIRVTNWTALVICLPVTAGSMGESGKTGGHVERNNRKGESSSWLSQRCRCSNGSSNKHKFVRLMKRLFIKKCRGNINFSASLVSRHHQLSSELSNSTAPLLMLSVASSIRMSVSSIINFVGHPVIRPQVSRNGCMLKKGLLWTQGASHLILINRPFVPSVKRRRCKKCSHHEYETTSQRFNWKSGQSSIPPATIRLLAIIWRHRSPLSLSLSFFFIKLLLYQVLSCSRWHMLQCNLELHMSDEISS